jgi:hypothetical protein
MDPTREVGAAARRAPSLAQARVVWAALVVGVVAFLALSVSYTISREGASKELADLLFWVAVGLTGTLVPASWFARAAIHARARGEDGVLPPQAWFTGHVVQWALCEGAAFFGATATLLAVDKWPAAIPAVVGIVGLLYGYPTGSDLDGEGGL